jgi:hypothetical protein
MEMTERRRVVEMTMRKCAICEYEGKVIDHHVNYRTGETITLCQRCHMSVAHIDKLERIVRSLEAKGTYSERMFRWCREAPKYQKLAESKGVKCRR